MPSAPVNNDEIGLMPTCGKGSRFHAINSTVPNVQQFSSRAPQVPGR